MRSPVLEATCVFGNEFVVKSIPFDQQRTPCLKERQITIEPDWQVQVGKVGAPADETTRRLRIAEVDKASLAQRIDRNDLGASPPADQASNWEALVVAGRLRPPAYRDCSAPSRQSRRR